MLTLPNMPLGTGYYATQPGKWWARRSSTSTTTDRQSYSTQTNMKLNFGWGIDALLETHTPTVLLETKRQ